MDNFLDYDDNWLTQHKARFTAMEIWQQPDLWEALGDELALAQPIWQAFLTPLLATHYSQRRGQFGFCRPCFSAMAS